MYYNIKKKIDCGNIINSSCVFISHCHKPATLEKVLFKYIYNYIS